MAASAKLRGFAGLGSMVSDIGIHKAANTLSGSAVAPPSLPGARTQPTDQDGSRGSGRSSGGRVGIILGILAVVVLLAVIIMANAGNQPSYRPTQTYVPPPPPPVPTYKPAPPPYAPAPTYKPSPPPYIPTPAPQYDANVEAKPPFGSGHTLSRDQIRYCESQKIRVSAWQGALNRYSSTAINAFNAAVDDYNARCSNYRYYSGVLESVRSEVEARRYSLMAEGRALAAANP
jgi:hypothetical protein